MMGTNQEERIIQSGIHFMQSIAEVYGAEEGLKLWNTISSTLDPSLKGKIFFALLTNQYTDSITILSVHHMCDKIAVIKAFRTVDKRKLGLKEAKDLADTLWLHKSVKLEVDPVNRPAAISQLRTVGCII